MVGPDFHKPCTPHRSRFTNAPLPKKTASTAGLKSAGKAQHFIPGRDIPGDWWKIFHSPIINALVCRGLAHSPNLAAAKATLIQAQETLSAQIRSSLFPAFSAQINGQRQSFSYDTIGAGSDATRIFNIFNATVNLTYTLDMFGGARRQIEALQAQVDYNQFLLQAAYLTLTTNIVTTAIAIASNEAQIVATLDLIKYQQDQLNIMKKQFRLGGISETDIFNQQNQLAQTQATLPPLQQNVDVAQHTLAVLIGVLPSDLPKIKLNLDHLVLPSELPVSLPSCLVRQRPDIQASEALLHVASAQVGVAVANFYPQINISSAYGFTNFTLANLFSPGNKVWNYGATITQPIFQFGALQARKRAAIAAYQNACAQYRQTVLQAFKNVADILRALQHDAQRLKAERAAEVAARRALMLTRDQYRLGAVDFINLLLVEKTYQQARIERIQAEAARYNDTAGLFQALGGGWWNAHG